MAKQASLGGKPPQCLFPGSSERASTRLALHEVALARGRTLWTPVGSGTGWGQLPQPGGMGHRTPRFPRSQAISGRICSVSSRRAGLRCWLVEQGGSRRWCLLCLLRHSHPFPSRRPCLQRQPVLLPGHLPTNHLGNPQGHGRSKMVTGEAQVIIRGLWNLTVGCW